VNEMTDKFDIAALVDDLEPVTALNPRRPLLIAAAITALMMVLIAWTQGMRADIIAGHPDAMFLIRAGILLLLGSATAHAVTAMASPAVGKSNNGWQIALAAAVVFPLSALIIAATGDIGPAMVAMQSGMECLTYSAIGGLATAVPMVLALRRGAPTSPTRAGWMVGIASGGLGAFAYNLHCPYNNIVYIGLWYTLAVAGCAVVGRLVVPRMIRW
jgi:hypothetical protein